MKDGRFWDQQYSMNARFLVERGERMKGFLIGAVIVGAAFVMYCCIRVGAREDRILEEMEKKNSETVTDE